MVKRYSLTEDRKRNTDRKYKYESTWGTPSEKRSKLTTSIALAKHPLATWAKDIQEVAAKIGFTTEEREACQALLHEIDQVGDIEGVQWFRIKLPTIGMSFEACVSRLPAPPTP